MMAWHIKLKSVALCALALLACDSNEQTLQASRSETGVVAAEPQREGDAQKGRDVVLNTALVRCGIPKAAYEQFAGNVAPAPLEGRDSINAKLPHNLTAYTTANGTELVTANCLTCHAAMFNGELVLGLGNESLDLTRDPRLFAEGVGAYVTDTDDMVEWQKWADRINTIAPYVVTDTVGVNSAVNLTWALFAHRDAKTLSWSDEPVLEPPPRTPLPVSVPPWWRMAKKHSMFYTSGGRGDHARHMILASMLCTDSISAARAIDELAPDIRAFIASMEAPTYPFEIDTALANHGKQIFEDNCSRCHGRYGETPDYPNLVIALEEIGTDPALALAATDGSEDRFAIWLEQSFFGALARAAPARGYAAPPLDGVWATAPFLHNGSVPTIQALLNSKERPSAWTRSFDSTDYDTNALGWTTEIVTTKKATLTDSERRKRVYDTSRPGFANSGHTYGDHLTDTQRAQVIEYLKTL